MLSVETFADRSSPLPPPDLSTRVVGRTIGLVQVSFCAFRAGHPTAKIAIFSRRLTGPVFDLPKCERIDPVPRGKIEISNYVESLSILDPQGNVDTALEPKLDAQELRRLYAAMLRARRYDERMLKLQRQGRIGTYGPALGQEAASLGPAFAITQEDWLIPSFREPSAMLYRGWPMKKLILWWGGNEEGSRVPEGINDLPICVPVSTQCLYGAGIAWGCKIGVGQVRCGGAAGRRAE